MNVSEVKAVLNKQAITFQTGGLRSTEEIGESWIGKVIWGMKGQEEHLNFEPLLTLFLNDLPFVPLELAKFKLVTIHMDYNVFDNLTEENLASYFKITCYTDLNGIERLNETSKKIKPFPLKPILIQDDTPSREILDESNPEIFKGILKLEEEEDIEYYGDIAKEVYDIHKLGGYPSFTQSGVYYGDDYPFVFQLYSDAKAQFNVVDGGGFYFFYNSKKQDWIVHCDFF